MTPIVKVIAILGGMHILSKGGSKSRRSRKSTLSSEAGSGTNERAEKRYNGVRSNGKREEKR